MDNPPPSPVGACADLETVPQKLGARRIPVSKPHSKSQSPCWREREDEYGSVWPKGQRSLPCGWIDPASESTTGSYRRSRRFGTAHKTDCTGKSAAPPCRHVCLPERTRVCPGGEVATEAFRRLRRFGFADKRERLGIYLFGLGRSEAERKIPAPKNPPRRGWHIARA